MARYERTQMIRLMAAQTPMSLPPPAKRDDHHPVTRRAITQQIATGQPVMLRGTARLR